ncbi:hypothetical protein OIO90_006012 [Microbotryomycetes sp. JL221]|nr:hypothetical protein OIO90_006012 [Microbotryomycetes sp. JL221]
MASSTKFSDLPDIDTAPDVYETPDAPPEHNTQFDSDSDDDFERVAAHSRAQAAKSNDESNFDGSRLDLSRARTRFKHATASSNVRDAAAHRMTRRIPSATEYVLQPRARAGDETTSTGETPLERLRRLRTEIAELEEDVQREQAQKEEDQRDQAEAAQNASGSGDQKLKRMPGEVTPAVILQQLQLLKGDIRSIESSNASVHKSEPNAANSGDPALPDKPRSSSISSAQGLKSPSTSDVKALPSVPPVPRTTLGDNQLEQRLAAIEKLLGTQEADVDDVSGMPVPVFKTVSRLDHLVSMLAQPRHLDAISRRVKVLVTDLERLHESRRKLGDTRPLNVALSGGMTVTIGGADKNVPLTSLGASIGPSSSRISAGADTVPPDALQKIDALFNILPRLEPLIPLTPRLLARLRSLSDLHIAAADFGTTLTEVKNELGKLTDGKQGLKEVIAELSQSLGDNEERLKGNLEAIESRIKVLNERMDKLSL